MIGDGYGQLGATRQAAVVTCKGVDGINTQICTSKYGLAQPQRIDTALVGCRNGCASNDIYRAVCSQSSILVGHRNDRLRNVNNAYLRRTGARIARRVYVCNRQSENLVDIRTRKGVTGGNCFAYDTAVVVTGWIQRSGRNGNLTVQHVVGVQNVHVVDGVGHGGRGIRNGQSNRFRG